MEFNSFFGILAIGYREISMRVIYKFVFVVAMLTHGFFVNGAQNTQLAPIYRELNQQIGNNPKIALEQLQAIDISRADNLTKAQHYYTFSQLYLSLVYPQKALEYANQALILVDEMSQTWFWHRINLAKSQALDVLNRADEGLPLALAASAWMKENYREYYVDSLIAVGYLYNTQGKHSEALKSFMLAYELAPVSGDFMTKGSIAGSIALVYEYRSENELSIPFFRESVEYQRKTNNLLELSISLYGLGRANNNIGNRDLGQSQLQESLEISRKIDDRQGVAYALNELALIELQNKNYEQALQMYSEASEIFAEGGSVSKVWDSLDSLAEVYIKIGDVEKAENAFKKSLTYLSPDTMPTQSMKSRERKAMILAAKGQYQEAYELLESTYVLKQKYLSKQSTEKLHELRARYEVESKEKENLLLAGENEKNKFILFREKKENQILWLGIIIAGTIVFFLILLAHNSRQQKKELQKLAHTDGLTGLSNRLHIIEYLEKEKQSLGKGEKLYLCMVDLDYFKKINDKFGHVVGDQVLVEFAKLCQRFIQKPDKVGRLGGEEFLIILHQCNEKQAYEKVLLLNQNMFQIADELKLSQDVISFSAGLGFCERDDELELQLKKSDDALYQAKNQGRNKIILAQIK